LWRLFTLLIPSATTSNKELFFDQHDDDAMKFSVHTVLREYTGPVAAAAMYISRQVPGLLCVQKTRRFYRSAV